MLRTVVVFEKRRGTMWEPFDRISDVKEAGRELAAIAGDVWRSSEFIAALTAGDEVLCISRVNNREIRARLEHA
jgi:hypothetical protein